MISSKPMYLLMVPSQNTSPWGIRPATYEFWGHTIQSIAPADSDFLGSSLFLPFSVLSIPSPCQINSTTQTTATYSYKTQYARYCSRSLMCINSFNPCISQRGQNHYYPSFTDYKTEREVKKLQQGQPNNPSTEGILKM